MANSSSNKRIGLCIMCEPALRSGREVGTTGYWLTNINPASLFIPQVCKVCDGKGYVYFRSDK